MKVFSFVNPRLICPKLVKHFLGGKALDNKFWPLLYKRAKLDLRLTKNISFLFQGQIGEACEDVKQIVKVMPVGGSKWNWLLEHLIEFTSSGSVLIFVTKKANCEELAHNLKAKEFEVGLLHGDLNQVKKNFCSHS